MDPPPCTAAPRGFSQLHWSLLASSLRNDFDPLAELAFVDACRAGHPSRMTELCERLTCVRRMLRIRNRAMGFPLSPTELEDVEQETVMTILRRLPSFRPVAPFEAWVHGICCRLLLDAARSKRQRSARFTELAEDIGDATRDPTASLADWSEVEGLLERLGGIEADVVQLKYLEDLTFEEIGRRLEMLPNTAKSHYYRGLTRLRAALQDPRSGDDRI